MLTGFVSYRHPEQGTWMVRALVEALYKHSGQADIKSIYEQVLIAGTIAHAMQPTLFRNDWNFLPTLHDL